MYVNLNEGDRMAVIPGGPMATSEGGYAVQVNPEPVGNRILSPVNFWFYHEAAADLAMGLIGECVARIAKAIIDPPQWRTVAVIGRNVSGELSVALDGGSGRNDPVDGIADHLQLGDVDQLEGNDLHPLVQKGKANDLSALVDLDGDVVGVLGRGHDNPPQVVAGDPIPSSTAVKGPVARVVP